MRSCLAPLVIAGLAASASVAFAAQRASHAGHHASLIDLHRYNWRKAVVPASVCGTIKPVQLRHSDASAVVRSKRWAKYPRIMVAGGASHLAYGDLNGDGRDEAALQVVCANLGGTAAGQLAFAVVVYRPGRNAPVPVAILMPQVRGNPDFHVPLIEAKAIALSRVVTMEAFYGPRDGDCCASGLARTVWRLRGRRLLPASTAIVRRPKR